MLSAIGVEFVAVTTEVDELVDGLAPEELVLENARRKARAGLEIAAAGAGETSLGVDTEVVVDGNVLGKAADVDQARERLQALSGRTHEVLSAVVLRGLHSEVSRSGGLRSTPLSEAERSGVASSLVTFAQLSEATLGLYLASGEWRDRAGSYAIQGLGSLLIERVEGDFSNVVGLPLQLLLGLAPELFPGISSDSA